MARKKEKFIAALLALNVRGRRYDVGVTPLGMFSALDAEGCLDPASTSSTLVGLLGLLNARARRAEKKIAVPFMCLDRRGEAPTVRAGVVMARTVGAEEFVVRYGKGSFVEERGVLGVGRVAVRPLSADNLAAWKSLVRAKHAADKWLAQFESKHGVNLGQLYVEAAVITGTTP